MVWETRLEKGVLRRKEGQWWRWGLGTEEMVLSVSRAKDIADMDEEQLREGMV